MCYSYTRSQPKSKNAIISPSPSEITTTTTTAQNTYIPSPSHKLHSARFHTSAARTLKHHRNNKKKLRIARNSSIHIELVYIYAIVHDYSSIEVVYFFFCQNAHTKYRKIPIIIFIFRLLAGNLSAVAVAIFYLLPLCSHSV